MFKLLPKKTLILLGVVGLLCLVVVTVSLTQLPTPKTQNPSPIPQVPMVSTLQKTQPGKTTTAQLATLLSNAEKNQLADNQESFEYFNSSPIRPNQVITRDNNVVFEKVILPLDKNDPNYIRLDSALTTYGQPSQIIEGSYTYGPATSLYLFSSKGIALVGNPFTNTLFEIHTFVPITNERYLEQFGKEFGEKSHTDEPL